jgi:hypothetical protein
MTRSPTPAPGVTAHLIEDMQKTVPEHLLPHIAKPDQVANLIHTTVDALAQDRYRGKGIPFVKIGGRVRYLREDVLTYLAANRIGGSAA